MDISISLQRVFGSLLDQRQVPAWLAPLMKQVLPKAAVVVLVLLISELAARITWSLIPEPATQTITLQTQQSAAPEKEALDIAKEARRLASLHLFGRPGVIKSNSAKVIQKSAPETRLNLTLHGVFVDDNPEKGAAIIGKAGSKQDHYKVGANIKGVGGVKLQAVYNDRVVLLRNGQSEVLRFPKTKGGGISTRGKRSRPSGSTGNTAANTSLRSYKDLFQKEPLKIMQHLRFVPVRSGKKLKGYRLLPQKDRKLYNRLGVRPSDLVTAVNGIPLDDERQAFKLLDTLKKAEQLEVTILRQGNVQSLSFSLK
ncbi:general secretion pathway protein GspC [Candidatus Endoriftia persephone str. Guaymas]|jgi:general secretion pathway protein C|uniref:General secretion pathway protein C n=3 Tax=Gammaproteobacteria TaxID=1236 RepID=G2FGM6_9GAMM|nr:type II secretion system protein GspC [Candidatus Endoriftia persephone]EGV50152.1 general secretion pathway protein C [endosymbiont of Riftia pachyptila (vent Ph05)]EGW53990.1 general secretion pathway protein C [endosymbiont of Tevnia jerichonana (vent Tica)]MBA1331984.1 general secretion pathway protein GspC [Candidatus Endoriftia persephone str. Guaymas]USF86537.1 type II secretion system protein GspC [Candidatus Endoriftia persephone]